MITKNYEKYNKIRRVFVSVMGRRSLGIENLGQSYRLANLTYTHVSKMERNIIFPETLKISVCHLTKKVFFFIISVSEASFVGQTERAAFYFCRSPSGIQKAGGTT